MKRTKMRKWLTSALIVGGVTAAVSPAGPAALSAQQAGPEMPIRLKQLSFDPLRTAPAMLRANALETPGQPGLYLLQFEGPVRNSWKNDVQQLGAHLYGYIPDHAFIARIDPTALSALRALTFVRWIGPYAPAYRIAPELSARSAEASEAANITTTLLVQALPDADPAVLEAVVAKLGGVVEASSATTLARYLRVRMPARQSNALASIDGVLWVEPALPVKLLNEPAGKIMRVTEVRKSVGLYGAGQIVAVADTGLDVGSLDNLHLDVKGRVVKAYCLGRPAPCDWSDPNGHGTHVSGSVIGNGASSGSTPASRQFSASHAGMAPEAGLVMQSIGDGQGGLEGIPADRGALMRQAYADGARIHTNSWGGITGLNPDQTPKYGGYVQASQQVDLAAWENKDMLILFAAGNEGADDNKNGVVDPDSIGQPGTAKNVLTVGASEDEHPTFPATWTTGYGYAAPIVNTSRADNRNGMAAFSSRGPTDDGRIKPDVVAPGTQVVSVRTQKNTFESSVESNSSSFTQTPLGGGTSAWQIVADAHSAPSAWFQSASGSRQAKAITVLFSPRLNLGPIGGIAALRLWHKFRLTGDNKLAIVFTDGAKTLWLLTSRSGAQSTYVADQFGIPIGDLAQNGLNIQSISIGFALYSASGSYNSDWTIDDIRFGAFMGSLSDAGAVPPDSPQDLTYGIEDGTSMATPLTAGSAAVLREWFARNGMPNPSSALLKAALMNSAADMSPGQYGPGAAQEVPAIRPNNVSGWGRVDVMNAISPALPSVNVHMDAIAGLRTGDTAVITFTISAPPTNTAQVFTTSGLGEATRPMLSSGSGPMPAKGGTRAMGGLLTIAEPAAIQSAQAVDQLVVNGGFEQDATWQANGDTFTYFSGESHSGSRSARSKPGFDGDMWQFIAIPSDAVTATLEFFWKNINPDVGLDELQVVIYDQALQTRLGSSNFLSSAGTSWQSTSLTFGQSLLDNTRGTTIALMFEKSQDNAAPHTVFHVDDANLYVGRGAPSATATSTPVTPGPTNTPPGPSSTPTTPGPTATATPPGPTNTPVTPGSTTTPSPGQPAGPVAITLAWTDYPGEPAAAKALVNDLDLEIEGPDGVRFFGNQNVYAAGSPCLRDGKYDTCNNAESIYIANASAGQYRIIIRGAQIAQGGAQPFAVAATGPSLKTTGSSTGGGLAMKVYLPLVRK